jgi:hypothetical protein
MINVNTLQDALPIIIRNDSVFEQIKSDFPDILADLVTFKANPNCTCRGRVFKFFTEQLEKEPSSLNKYVTDEVNLQAELKTLSDQRLANNYAGRVFVIARTEEAWTEFTRSLVGKAFRSFSISERENTVAVYFL